jgi:hypothetical protein
MQVQKMPILFAPSYIFGLQKWRYNLVKTYVVHSLEPTRVAPQFPSSKLLYVDPLRQACALVGSIEQRTLCCSGLPDFSSCKIPKREKYTKLPRTMYTKCP